MKYKIVRTDTYNSLLRCINKALDNNHELRKVCWCRQCKHFGIMSSKTALYIGDRCRNKESENYFKRTEPYGSCEKCERR
jgi:hypothetical protein